MPDKRVHRGPHPEDAVLFGPAQIPTIRAALADYCLLLTKGYASPSALKLVGDHFALNHRQRLAIMRSACSDFQLDSRINRRLDLRDCAAKPLAIDGYNLLITIEAALSGAPIFIGRDHVFRDLSGIHGTYRKVQETIPAAQLIGNCLHSAGITDIHWYLDSPVSNSGRLKTLLREFAQSHNWNWAVTLTFNPDKALTAADAVVATSDSIILDTCRLWTNLSANIITTRIPTANLIHLEL